MDEALREKLMYLAKLNYNPLSDINSVNRLKKELEMINVADFSPEDWQLYNEATK